MGAMPHAPPHSYRCGASMSAFGHKRANPCSRHIFISRLNNIIFIIFINNLNVFANLSYSRALGRLKLGFWRFFSHYGRLHRSFPYSQSIILGL